MIVSKTEKSLFRRNFKEWKVDWEILTEIKLKER